MFELYQFENDPEYPMIDNDRSIYTDKDRAFEKMTWYYRNTPDLRFRDIGLIVFVMNQSGDFIDTGDRLYLRLLYGRERTFYRWNGKDLKVEREDIYDNSLRSIEISHL